MNTHSDINRTKDHNKIWLNKANIWPRLI